ncbi:hypothetical protein [Nocardioides ochotonae]|uniref:hypothetical protein n=1 Tax=Nocardioides ochotonae TaxID=2685869 RepID=UPI00140BEEB6|nr:hypothetical protein [Nocardioides ochotonae]
MSNLSIDEFTTRRYSDAHDGEPAGGLHWTTRHDLPRESVGGGVDTGAVLVRINVDEQYDAVIVDGGATADWKVIDQAIEALQEAKARLVAMYGDDLPAGRCLRHGDWGRCRRHDHHPLSDCNFPTLADA